MEASDTDSSFSAAETDSDLENLYDSDSECTRDNIGDELAVSGWLYEPLRPVNDLEDGDDTDDASSEATGPTQSRIGTTNW